MVCCVFVFVCDWVFLCVCEFLFETYRVMLHSVFIYGVLFFVSVGHVDVFVCCVWFIAWCCTVSVLCVCVCLRL